MEEHIEEYIAWANEQDKQKAKPLVKRQYQGKMYKKRKWGGSNK